MSNVLISEWSTVIRSAPSVPASLTCRETLRVMFQHPESKCIVVCNEVDEPVGLLMCERFFLKATGGLGADHFYQESITRLMIRNPLIADLSGPTVSVLAEAMNRPEMMKNDCIIITSQGKLSGVVYPSDMMESPLEQGIR